MNWYIRINSKVSGPFPARQLQQSVLLGRLGLDDEVSQDKAEWIAVRKVSELVPSVLSSDLSDAQARERLAAARRWADERRGERREADKDNNRLGPGRRTPEAYGTMEHRYQRESMLRELKKYRDKVLGGVVLFFIILGAGIYAGFAWIPPAAPSAKCDAEAMPGVNWMHCDLSGLQRLNTDLRKAKLNSANLQAANLFAANLREADIAYVNFTQAKLSFAQFQHSHGKGANFVAADLSHANFEHADMSYANFKNANLSGAVFNNTRLDHAIWVDGKTCLLNSIGQCNQ